MFTKVINLEDLNLSYNKLSNLRGDSFEGLKKLKKILLQGNLFRNIPVDAIERMEGLEELDLSKNNIMDLLLKRDDNSVLKRIKRLNLNQNRIRTLTRDAFPDLNSL